MGGFLLFDSRLCNANRRIPAVMILVMGSRPNVYYAREQGGTYWARRARQENRDGYLAFWSVGCFLFSHAIPPYVSFCMSGHRLGGIFPTFDTDQISCSAKRAANLTKKGLAFTSLSRQKKRTARLPPVPSFQDGSTLCAVVDRKIFAYMRRQMKRRCSHRYLPLG